MHPLFLGKPTRPPCNRLGHAGIGKRQRRSHTDGRSLQPAIQSLIRKEIVERSNGGYRLTVELFARWIVKNQV
jgi:hypothetical protein